MGISVFPAASGASFAAIQPTLKHTVNSSQTITLDTGTTVVYAVVSGGGGGGGAGSWTQGSSATGAGGSGVGGQIILYQRQPA